MNENISGTWHLHTNVKDYLLFGIRESNKNIDIDSCIINRENQKKRKLVLCSKNSNIGETPFVSNYQDVKGEIKPVGNYVKGGIFATRFCDDKIVFKIKSKSLRLVFQKMFVYNIIDNNILCYLSLDKEVYSNVDVNIEIETYQSMMRIFNNKLEKGLI